MTREELIKKLIDEAEAEGPLYAASAQIWDAIPRSDRISWKEFKSIVDKVAFIDFLLRDSIAQNYTQLKFILEKLTHFLNLKLESYKADWINTCIYILGIQLTTLHAICISIKTGKVPSVSRFEEVLATENIVCFEDKPSGFHEVIDLEEL